MQNFSRKLPTNIERSCQFSSVSSQSSCRFCSKLWDYFTRTFFKNSQRKESLTSLQCKHWRPTNGITALARKWCVTSLAGNYGAINATADNSPCRRCSPRTGSPHCCRCQRECLKKQNGRWKILNGLHTWAGVVYMCVCVSACVSYRAPELWVETRRE